MKDKKLTKPIIISCFFAGCLEMYDFVIFGFLAPVIHANYLSFLDETTGLIIAYLLFAVGFICRPIGAIIFGHIGDKYGRKRALVISMSLMGMSSLALCLLPKYNEIGVVACYLIALIRIIQGISVGGEYSGAAIYAIEHTSKANIGAVGSTVLAGTTLGVLLATFISNLLENQNLPEYSWRFAFLLGFGLSIIGYFIRRNLQESPLFSKENLKSEEKPLFYGIRKFKKQFIAAILLSGANNANYYFALVFIPNYFKTQVDDSIEFNNWMLAFFMLLLEPTFGWLSDKWGRNRVLIIVCLILSIYNLFFLDMLINMIGSIFGVGLILLSAILLSVTVASVNIFVLEIFPARCRYSCGALSYSIGAAVFGGTTPLVCSLITEYIGNKPIYFGIYISAISLLGALGGWLVLKNPSKKVAISRKEGQLQGERLDHLLSNG
jgi:MHS family proline/betaine transporter-like MFS transporter